MPTKIKKLPVLVLSGFLGSGKTTLINSLLSNNQNLKIALLINDLGEVNIDADLIKRRGLEISHTTENVVEISNGCICCTLREDLLIEVKKIHKQNKYDYLVIESSGISEPIPVAQTFVFDEGVKDSLNKITKLDCMLTTVDCSNFLKMMENGKTLIDTGQALGDEDLRSISGLLIEQIEFCNIIVLTKTDLVDKTTKDKVQQLLIKLNPYAQIIESVKGEIDFSKILDTNLFDFDKASSQAGWISELAKAKHTPETDEYGITSFVYRARRAFDKDKFYDLLLSGLLKNVVRAKGYYWLSDDNQNVYEFSQSGINLSYDSPIGFWWAAVDPKNYPTDIKELQIIKKNFVEPFETIGDRRQEIVFIGQKLDPELIIKNLDNCLILGK